MTGVCREEMLVPSLSCCVTHEPDAKFYAVPTVHITNQEDT